MTDDEILAANDTYGSLGELAIMTLPKTKILSLFRSLEVFFNRGIFWILLFFVLYSTLLHLPPLRFHCVEGCWDRTQEWCNFGIGSQTLKPIG